MQLLQKQGQWFCGSRWALSCLLHACQQYINFSWSQPPMGEALTSGCTLSSCLQVRVHSVTQSGASDGTSPRRAAANRRAATTKQRKELSLAVVLERARSRLQVGPTLIVPVIRRSQQYSNWTADVLQCRSSKATANHLVGALGTLEQLSAPGQCTYISHPLCVFCAAGGSGWGGCCSRRGSVPAANCNTPTC